MGLESGREGPGALGGRDGWVHMIGVGEVGSVGSVRVGIVRCGRLVFVTGLRLLLRHLCSVVVHALVIVPLSVVGLGHVVLG